MSIETTSTRRTVAFLRRQVESGLDHDAIRRTSEWGGADVIITSKPLERETSKTVVLTEHAQALSWLIEQLRDEFQFMIDQYDYLSKHQFFWPARQRREALTGHCC